jgi:ribonuclease-3
MIHMISEDLQALMKDIGYEFQDVQLLKRALCHRSFGKDNNERLEFLGDSILNFIVAHELFDRFPKAREGDLSRLRSNLVNEDTLAKLAFSFNLGSFIHLGAGELKSGGRNRPSILADCVEAVIGAIYLDGSMKHCYQIVANWYAPQMQQLSLSDIQKDPKSLLQELLQAEQLPLPKYRLVKTTGLEHERVFMIEGQVALLDHPVIGEGRSRRRAEQAVANKILEELQHAE